MNQANMETKHSSNQCWTGWKEPINLPLPSLPAHHTLHPLRKLTWLRSEKSDGNLVVFLPGLHFWGRGVRGSSYRRFLHAALGSAALGSKDNGKGFSPDLLLIDYDNSLWVHKKKARWLPNAISDAIAYASTYIMNTNAHCPSDADQATQGSNEKKKAPKILLMGHSFGSLLARRAWVTAAETASHGVRAAANNQGTPDDSAINDNHSVEATNEGRNWWMNTKGIACLAGSNQGFEIDNPSSPGLTLLGWMLSLTEKLIPQLIDIANYLNFSVLAIYGRRSHPWIYATRVKWLRLFEGEDTIPVPGNQKKLESFTLYINGGKDQLVGADDLEMAYQLGSCYKIIRLDGLVHESFLDEPGGGTPSAADFLDRNADKLSEIRSALDTILKKSPKEAIEIDNRKAANQPSNSEENAGDCNASLPKSDWIKITRVSSFHQKGKYEHPQKGKYEQRVIFLIHGIRDYGDWQENIEYQIRRLVDLQQNQEGHKECSSSQTDPKVIPIRYGYFNALQFLLPSERRRVVRSFSDEYYRVMTRYPDLKQANTHVYAHSNGTFVFAEALQRYEDIKVNRVLLGGSVLPTQFNWSRLLNKTQQVKQVINYAANADMPTGLLCRGLSFPWISKPWLGIGPAGTDGFRELMNQESHSANYFLEGDHGATLQPGNHNPFRIACYLLMDSGHEDDDRGDKGLLDGVLNTYKDLPGKLKDINLRNPLDGYSREDIKNPIRPYLIKKCRENRCTPVVQKRVVFGYQGIWGWGRALIALIAATLVILVVIPWLAVMITHPRTINIIVGAVATLGTAVKAMATTAMAKLLQIVGTMATLFSLDRMGFGLARSVYTSMLAAIAIFTLMIYALARF